MKKLMAVTVAVLGLAAAAQEPVGPQEGMPRGPRGPMMGGQRGPMAGERAPMMRGGMSAGMPADPAVMAVMNPRVAEKLGLSDEVKAQLKQLDREARESIKDLQQKTKAAMDRQASLLKESKIDEAAVMTAIDELFDLRKAMAKAQTKRIIAVKALLTPEQLEKALGGMKELRDSRRARGANGPRGPRKADGEAAPAAPAADAE